MQAIDIKLDSKIEIKADCIVIYGISRDSGAIFGLLLLKSRVRDAAAFAAILFVFARLTILMKELYNLPICRVQSH